MLTSRQDRFDGQPDLNQHRLVSIDKTRLSMEMVRLRGRAYA
ncbi:hypothetical protein [Acetobacter musti]|nr:hypothetical protein [Acetobacter musti]